MSDVRILNCNDVQKSAKYDAKSGVNNACNSEIAAKNDAKNDCER